MPVRKQPTDPFGNSASEASDLIRQQKLAQLKSAAANQRRGPSSADQCTRPLRRSVSDTAGAHAARPQKSSFGKMKMRTLLYVLSAALVVCVGALLIVVVASLTNSDWGDELARQRYVSPYNWEQLSLENGRYSYVVNGQIKSRTGIDVSENQHFIDWNAVANDGIQFAFIRLGYRGATAGDLYLDKYYSANIKGAQAAGIDCGIYFFSQAKTVEEAREEADFVLQYLDGVELQYPVVFDSEEKVIGVSQSRTAGLDSTQMTAIAEAFCNRIEEAGYETMIYGNAADISRYRRANLAKRGLWWAEYGVPTPNARIDFNIWQYSHTGSVDGIDVDVDMNIDLTHALD